jgi:hypothetical protein
MNEQKDSSLYLITLESVYTRDIQVREGDWGLEEEHHEDDMMDEGWVDTRQGQGEIVLGIVAGSCEQDARTVASAAYQYNTLKLKAYKLANS